MELFITTFVDHPWAATILVLMTSAISTVFSWLVARFTGLGDILVKGGFAKYESSLQRTLESHKADLRTTAHRYGWYFDRRAEVAATAYEKLATAVASCEVVITPTIHHEMQSNLPERWREGACRSFFGQYRDADLYVRQKRLFLTDEAEKAMFATLSLVHEQVDRIEEELPFPECGPNKEGRREFLKPAHQSLVKLKASLKTMLLEDGHIGAKSD